MELTFLGLIVSDHGIKPHPRNVSVIEDEPQVETKKKTSDAWGGDIPGKIYRLFF